MQGTQGFPGDSVIVTFSYCYALPTGQADASQG
jgi:hypothetical protein